MDATVEHFTKQFDDVRPNAAETEGENIGAKQHHHTHFWLGQRISDPAGVAANEIQLKFFDFTVRNADVGQLAESRIDAINDFVAPNNVVDHFP